MTTKNHHFFLLDYSPWPVSACLGSFNLLFSLLLMFKSLSEILFSLSILNVCIISMFWWFSYSGEFNLEGKSSAPLEAGIKFSMLLFISSEVFFFFSFFWSYFHFFFSPSFETGLVWPSEGVQMFDFLNVPLINTLILLSSGVTITVSHYFLIRGEHWLSNFFLGFTILLGCLFSALQVLEYGSSFFSLSDSNFGTCFFVLTGFHGIHVLVGTCFLGASFLRSLKLCPRISSSLSFELAAWYWHFVDVVWIFLYFTLYYMNS